MILFLGRVTLLLLCPAPLLLHSLQDVGGQVQNGPLRLLLFDDFLELVPFGRHLLPRLAGPWDDHLPDPAAGSLRAARRPFQLLLSFI